MEYFRTHCSWRNNYSKCCLIGTIISIVVLVIIAVISVIGVRYGRFNEKSSLHMTPGDTRLISYSSEFCESLTLTNTGQPNNLETTFKTVRTKPELSVTNKFQITVVDLTLNYGLYQFWRFYLYPGSTFEAKACILYGKEIELDVISGQSNFSHWLASPGSFSHVVRRYTITVSCSNEITPLKNLTFPTEDEYYFAFIGNDDDSTGINATLNFTGPEYYASDIISQCATGRRHGRSCTATVPFHSHSYGLISVENVSLGTYDSSASVDVKWSCNPRVGLYVGITIAVVVFIIIEIIVALLCSVKVKCSREYASIQNTNGTGEQIVSERP